MSRGAPPAHRAFAWLPLATNWLPWIAAAVVAAAAFGFAFVRGPDQNWDLLNYHYYAGHLLLDWRMDRDVAAAGVQTFLNPTVDLLPYLAYRWLRFPWNAYLIVAVQLLSVPLVVALCKEASPREGTLSPLALTLTLLVSVASPLWWSELGTSFSSATTAPLVLLALLFALRSVGDSEGVRRASLRFAFAGTSIGFAVGLRLTNAPFALAVPVVLVTLLPRARLRLVIQPLAAYAFGALLGFGMTAWWNLFLWRDYGSPFYPFYNALFQSPYFEPVNFRDLRWRFHTPREFLSFVFEAAAGTSRTSEVRFADARWAMLLILTMIAVAAIPRSRAHENRADSATRGVPASEMLARTRRVRDGTVLFFTTSLFLWAMFFAYQRYLVPLELTAGIVLWILLSSLIADYRVTPALGALLVIVLYTVKIPDWGHSAGANGAGQMRFAPDLPHSLRERPFVYLVAGGPNSYLFPFLHQDSRFVRIDFTPKFDEKIVAALRGTDLGAIRVITEEAAMTRVIPIAERFGVPSRSTVPWRCLHFRSLVDVYAVCGPDMDSPGIADRPRNIEVDFSGTALYPTDIVTVSGLSAPEGWGRWSDGRIVTIDFASCLPAGTFDLDLTAHAFGSNIGAPILVRVGDSIARLTLTERPAETSVTFAHRGTGCDTSLIFEIPHPVSPAALGLSADARTLGIALSKLAIRARSDVATVPSNAK